MLCVEEVDCLARRKARQGRRCQRQPPYAAKLLRYPALGSGRRRPGKSGTVVVAVVIQGLNPRRGRGQAYAHVGLHVRRTLAAVTRPGKRVGWPQR